MERLLINIEDVREYGDIDPNYDEDRFNIFLRGIQRKNLREFLTPQLYLDMMNNISVTKYTELVGGKQYVYEGDTIEYLGLKPILCYLWLAKACREGEQFITNYGAVSFDNNTQEMFRRSDSKERIAQDHMQTAQHYMNEAIRFLDTNYTTYPLWERRIEKQGTQFSMFKI